jgi:glycosyltransferase involved in cell wall biosynthesis
MKKILNKFFLEILFLFLSLIFYYFSFFYKSYFDNLKNKTKKINNIIGVSIILPVYNVECCIIKCINSLLNQTLKNIEIILINDGSTDNTINILKYYSKLDTRIKVVNKNNGGVASARNLGVTLAKGKYIDFVDPDDFIELNTYEILYNLAEKY